jgi:regulator of protease activity HflC (stomatin/prohibitin superfamily)
MNELLQRIREHFQRLAGTGEGDLEGEPGASRRLMWLGAGALVLGILAVRSCASLDPGQAAIRVNNLTGNREVITQPGLILRLPFGIHDVYVVDVSPQTFHMRGQENRSALEVRELEVRASDGSNFVFTDTTILFRAIPGKTDAAIRDSGLGHAYYEWMLPYARAILRDEFGRESTISVSNPTNFGAATERARKRINELLGKHGIEVTSIVTPRPKFSQEYENLIEARNQAENQLAVIDSDLARAGTERERKLAEVQRDQNKIIQEKRAALEAELAEAVTNQTQTRREVDTYKIERVAAGEAARAAAKGKADELTGQLLAQYSTKKAEIEAFRNQPVERVMERLGERLKGVTIQIQPYRNDGSPQKIQLENVGGAQ